MTEDRVGNIAKAIGTVIAVIIIMLAIVAHAFGQHSHTDGSIKRFKLVRITAPAKILYVEPNEFGHKVEYVSQDKYEIENGSFQATKETKGETPKKGKWMWFVFCEEDRYLYAIYELTAEQKRTK